MENVLIKDSKSPTGYRMTRVAAYKRYKNTIKPLDDLIKYLDGLEEEKEK